MKKLMIAAVALTGLSAFALTSQNVVGYQGNTANATRNTMMAPTFLSVNSETGCTLADLTVTGYDAPVWDEEEGEYVDGCSGGDFILRFLNNDGSVAGAYYWIDDGETTPGWYANAGGKAITGGASGVEIPAGVAAWVNGKGMTLQSAGAVNKEDVAYTMNGTRNTATGNCMPVDLTLAQLTVSGYTAPVWDEEEGEYVDGCSGGDFILRFLNNDGSVAGAYYWIDDGETTPGWYANAGGKAITGGAASVEIPAGKGMWVNGKGMTLNIPAPEL